jgi:endonuclease/exonuclease/phosphatase family metal-dependent hydrolase
MSHRAPSISFQNTALRFLGVVFCALALVTISACEKKGTPAWDSPRNGTPAAEARRPDGQPVPLKSFAKTTKADAALEAPSSKKPSSGQICFITYNVENWLTMDRHVGDKNLRGAPKPENEKQAVIDILARHAPDVVGLCEIGTPSDLTEIQQKLKVAGLDLPHSHFTGGSDPERHLGLLSRFPIISSATPKEMEYQLTGHTYSINRGILDSTIGAYGKSYRFVGVHLKSKRDSEQGDQEQIRLNEARLLRRHLDSILEADENARLIVYGDFNDTHASPAIKTITGKANDPSYLTAIPAKDSQNDSWTHYWAFQDVYSRFDYIMVTREVRKETDFQRAKIIDDADWNKASDHRAVMAVFK